MNINDDVRNYANKIRTEANSASPTRVARAKNCLSHLTSEESAYFLKMINPIAQQSRSDPNMEKNILDKIKKIEGYQIIKKKQRKISQLIAVRIKNFFGVRKSTNEILKEMKNLKIVETECEKTLENLHSLLFDNDSILAMRKNFINDPLHSKNTETLQCQTEYRLLGLKSDSTEIELKEAYLAYLNKHVNETNRKAGTHAFRMIHMKIEAEMTFKEVNPLTLKGATEHLTKIKSTHSKEEIDKYEKSLDSLVFIHHNGIGKLR